MISCTEFIPSYSELFTYLEKEHGRDEVDRYWEYLFKPDTSPLYAFLEREGIKGCWTYWKGTLNEEAADFTMYLNEKRGFYHNVMHWCPSKGRLLQLKDTVGVEPYHDYCLHCDLYRRAAEKAGLKYIYNFNGTEKAACSMLIYDPKVFDGRVIIDEDTLVMDRKAADNEYFHRDFHGSLNSAAFYFEKKFDEAEWVEYLTRLTKNVYRPVIEAMAEKGLQAIADKITDTYEKEKALDVLTLDLSDNKLHVKVSQCPAVTYLTGKGHKMAPWYSGTTSVVMDVLAKAGGYKFEMISYNPENGAAEYCFTK